MLFRLGFVLQVVLLIWRHIYKFIIQVEYLGLEIITYTPHVK